MNCPSCGRAVDADSRFCKHCAFDLSKPATEQEATVLSAKPQPTKSKRILLSAGFGIIAVLVLGIVGGYIYKRHHAQAKAATNAAAAPSGPIVSDRAKQIEDKILRGETLSEGDIAGLSPYELRVLRNVHFARYGRKYDQTGELGSYFNTRPWYKPSDTYNDNLITAVDKANVKLIVSREQPTSTVVATPATTNSGPPNIESSTTSTNVNSPPSDSLIKSLIIRKGAFDYFWGTAPVGQVDILRMGNFNEQQKYCGGWQ